jgi:hypothetical protein
VVAVPEITLACTAARLWVSYGPPTSRRQPQAASVPSLLYRTAARHSRTQAITSTTTGNRMLDHQLTFRLTPADNAAIARIAAALRDRGQTFITRTDVVRLALEKAAKDIDSIAPEMPAAP